MIKLNNYNAMILEDSIFMSEDQLYDETKEYYEYDEITEENVQSFAEIRDNMNWEDMYLSIKGDDTIYVVLAKVETWHGIYDGGKILHGFERVLRECCSDYTQIYYKNSVLTIKSIHHDGTNIFKVRELTRKGLEYIENHPFISDRDLHTRLYKSSKYSCVPRLFLPQ